jgi:ParB-like chromosome segregation protein Spo0J
MPPHRITHPEKFEQLVNEFDTNGWDITEPVLIGYAWEEKIQLVSGSHRWAAAQEVDMLIPVEVYSYQYMSEIWGTEKWVELLAA